MSFLGDTLHQLRARRFLKQSDFEDVGISRSVIAQYETGRSLPGYENLQALARKLEVSVSVFFDGHPDEAEQRALLTLIDQGEHFERCKEWERALQSWEAAHDVATLHHMQSHIGYAKKRKGTALSRLGRWQEVMDTLVPVLADRAIPISPDDLYEILDTLALSTRTLGWFQESSLYLRMAAECVSPPDERWIRNAINRASVQILLGRWPQAAPLFRRAADVAHDAGFGTLEAWALLGWTTSQMNQGATEGVAASLKRIEELQSSDRDIQLTARLYHAHLMLSRLEGRLQEAKERLDLCLSTLTDDPEEQATLWSEALLLARDLPDPDLGQQAAERLANVDVGVPMRRYLDIELADYYQSVGDLNAGRIYLTRAGLTFKDSDDPNTRRIADIWEALMKGDRD